MPKMTLFPRATLGLAAGALVLGCGVGAALADNAITVSLWNKGGDSVMMGITLCETTVLAGMVAFNVTNGSPDITNEMVVSPIITTDEVLPDSADDFKIDEDAVGHLGKMAELDAGKSGTLGLGIKPGQYLLHWKIAGYYVGGKGTVLTVAEQRFTK
jgi:uncharacterized cupredoxin-like copper-binding protein